MEYVGRKVRKECPGLGLYEGTVNSFDSESNLYQISYRNGDSECLKLSGLVLILVEEDREELAGAVDLMTHKRLKFDDSSNFSSSLVVASVNGGGNCGRDDRIVDLNLNGGESSGGGSKVGLDLNVPLDEEVGECMELDGGKEGDRAHIIDLNVNVCEDVIGEMKVVGDDLENPRKELGFDLNCGVEIEKKEFDGMEEKEVDVSCDDVNGEDKGISVTPVDPAADYSGTVYEVGAVGVLEAHRVDESGSLQYLTMDRSNPGSVAVDICDKNDEIISKGNSRKRRKKTESADCETPMVLRRSARRGTPVIAVQVDVPAAVKHEPQSPQGRVVVEEKDVVLDCKEPEECNDIPTKPKLPPSSDILNLDDIPICDVFSVYSFLRSFSNLLFLSPFELGDFVAALRCKTPTLLFDYIHLSLLQILRKHLESLSDENSESASICLRSLDWNLLDLITWPVFMVEYLLTHHSVVSPDFDSSQLKLFESDYYKQPAVVKIKMLQCLCDDVNEVEIIRSELNRRTLTTDPSMDFDRKTAFETPKKARAVMDVSGTSWNSEVVDETADWNSDECCLCKMDGSLICCDGCPAAFHSRCVGVTTNLLPEGDWYCPECKIDKGNPLKRVEKSIRGAILLGTDPYDRLFYNSCGYLLVSDSDDIEFPFRYYHVNDFTAVLEAIKSSHIFYNTLLTAIMKYWNVSAKVTSEIGSQTVTVSIDYMGERQMPAKPLIPRVSVPLETCHEDDTRDKGNPLDKSSVSPISGNLGCEISEPEVLDNSMNASFHFESSGGAAESSQSVKGTRNLKNKGISTEPKVLENSMYDGTTALMSTNLDVVIKKDAQFAHSGSTPFNLRVGLAHGHCGLNYVNFYSFARTASLAAEALLHKASEKVSEKSRMSIEELISAQLKVLSNIPIEYRWSSIHNLDVEKEKCGWCISCKYPEEGGDCLFVTKDNGPFLKKFTSEVLDAHSTNEGHLIDLICHILCIEDRLHGLLLGPWLNPHYSVIWCKAICRTSDIASLKHFLVTLESNLNNRALSAEWHKQVDNFTSLGSASHIMSSSLRLSSKNGIGRRRPRFSDLEPKPSLKSASGLVQLWWRGGRISRGLYKWKVLPRSLVSKAARQGGCTKIPGIFYSESSDNAKRSRSVAWRASVEASCNVQQLALQVRELDANIKWDTFENIRLLSKMDKEFGKSVRYFKKVIIRRKSLEGTIGKYLLDFGKRRFIPDTVAKHGSMLEEPSSMRRKYWLEESYVPLHLLKAFEDRRIARKISKTSSSKHQESEIVPKTFSKKAGFAYLFSKAEGSEYHPCGLCKKDVLIREAVLCQNCEGFFHKKHVTKSTGLINSECTYTCRKCQDGACIKVGKKKGRPKLQKGSTSFKGKRSLSSKSSTASVKGKQPRQSKGSMNIVVPLRRSTRKVKLVSRQSESVGGRKKGKQNTFNKGKRPKKPRYPKKAKKAKMTQKQTYTIPSVLQKRKRSAVCYPYWLNGLRLSRKQNDERIMQFRSGKLILAFEQTSAILDKPQCGLCCETKLVSTLNYVCCEICGEWFHGDAFGLTVEKTGMLIGFRCHNCRTKAPPVCPHMHVIGADEGELDGSSAFGIQGSEEAYKSLAPEYENAGTGAGFSQILEQRIECEHSLVGLEQSTEGKHDVKEDNGRLANMPIGGDENNLMEDALLGESGPSVTESTLSERERPLVDSNVDIPDKS
ncbi:DDT domain-containing protein PTM isoform X2 [Daucus carota subsp. sativus]|uniref:DDT domain-containing protein PTM isoform X2 n=1 Tax=Daucus carota subsp. sativus TaxID=79200 RepID=UPI0007EF8B3E|nr:PREDICTED: DDT domain-containing protein PTM isoform X3 [Daucus carota subsp. sativus]